MIQPGNLHDLEHRISMNWSVFSPFTLRNRCNDSRQKPLYFLPFNHAQLISCPGQTGRLNRAEINAFFYCVGWTCILPQNHTCPEKNNKGSSAWHRDCQCYTMTLPERLTPVGLRNQTESLWTAATAQRLFFLPVIYAYRSIRSTQVRQLQKQSWVLHISSCNHPLLKRIPTGESPLGICPVKDSTVILQQCKNMVNWSFRRRRKSNLRLFYYVRFAPVFAPSRSGSCQKDSDKMSHFPFLSCPFFRSGLSEKDSETGRNRLQFCNRTSGRLSGKVPVSLRYSLRRVCPGRRKRDPFRSWSVILCIQYDLHNLRHFVRIRRPSAGEKARESESGNTGNRLIFAPFLPGKTSLIFPFLQCAFF